MSEGEPGQNLDRGRIKTRGWLAAQRERHKTRVLRKSYPDHSRRTQTASKR